MGKSPSNPTISLANVPSVAVAQPAGGVLEALHATLRRNQAQFDGKGAGPIAWEQLFQPNTTLIDPGVVPLLREDERLRFFDIDPETKEKLEKLKKRLDDDNPDTRAQAARDLESLLDSKGKPLVDYISGILDEDVALPIEVREALKQIVQRRHRRILFGALIGLADSLRQKPGTIVLFGWTFYQRSLAQFLRIVRDAIKECDPKVDGEICDVYQHLLDWLECFDVHPLLWDDQKARAQMKAFIEAVAAYLATVDDNNAEPAPTPDDKKREKELKDALDAFNPAPCP